MTPRDSPILYVFIKYSLRFRLGPTNPFGSKTERVSQLKSAKSELGFLPAFSKQQDILSDFFQLFVSFIQNYMFLFVKGKWNMIVRVSVDLCSPECDCG